MLNITSFQSVDYSNSFVWASMIMVYLTKIHQKIKYLFGIVGVVVVATIATPFIWVLLRYLNYKIGKYDLNTEISLKNGEHYKAVKRFQTEVKPLIESKILFDKMSSYWVFRGVGKQLLTLSKTMELIYNQIDTKLLDLDNVPKDKNGFTHISESELWNTRTKAYQYWI
jgi:hypothetical protein